MGEQTETAVDMGTPEEAEARLARITELRGLADRLRANASFNDFETLSYAFAEVADDVADLFEEQRGE